MSVPATESSPRRFSAPFPGLGSPCKTILRQCSTRLVGASPDAPTDYPYVLCDLFDPAWPQDVGGPFDLAVSAIVLHNLGAREKIFACYPAIHGLLKPGGCFLNYDRFVDGVEEHLIELRTAGFDRVECKWQQAPRAIVVATRTHREHP